MNEYLSFEQMMIKCIKHIEEKEGSARYMDIYDVFKRFYPNNMSPETLTRGLRKMAEKQLLFKYYDVKGRVNYSSMPLEANLQSFDKKDEV